jgi:hypothetical protein
VTATDRLIADRGYGLSRPQRDALRWLATAGREGSPPRRAVTWKVLERHRLVWRDPQQTSYGYSLTDVGLLVFRRMFPDGAT